MLDILWTLAKVLVIATGLILVFSLFLVTGFFVCLWFFLYFLAVFLIGMWKGPRGRLFDDRF